eukprot:CAMPEP_0177788418 /NCGR_PEP_ID=MMETSP0491_2-20121128/22104_1 /TAXON_ID=63592 /ORGANISM="Tetraselmis chuii, Strain PLY429" /LENGTH=347 /DNA_ID=CAMNT_0019310011 /DNA_START=1 /DNA_END=1043 /DNA_ORIENTATION=+
MSDDEGQSGKRRKSLETREGYEVVRPQVQMIEPQQPVKRRNSLEAMCSPSYIARESQRQASHRVSLDNCALENKRRLSQDLSRDVDKINHQLGQLLFAGGKPPDLGKDQPMGGSMDTRRTRTPQSYAGGRNSIGGGAASGSGFGSGSTAPSQAMPWQSAGESTTSTTLPWMSAPPVATCGGGTGLPWDQGAASGSGRNVLGANHRRTSVEALNRAVQQSGLPMGSGDPVQQPRRNSLQAMPGAEQMFAKMGPEPAHPAAPTTDMEALYSSPDDLVGFPEPPLAPPEHRGMAMNPPPPQQSPPQQQPQPPFAASCLKIVASLGIHTRPSRQRAQQEGPVAPQDCEDIQ